MDLLSTTRAFQQVLETHSFTGMPSNFSEEFAIKRFKKKFQKPNPESQKSLSQQCWTDWISHDEGLPKIGFYSKEWYLARDFLHRKIRAPNDWTGEFRFPKGSEFQPTRGQNSIEARLARSSWTCTFDNFEAFASVVYHHAGLKNAFRHRYLHWFRRSNFDLSLKLSNVLLYMGFRKRVAAKDLAFAIFRWKLERITVLTHGSRFSSVPKNNSVRRPINVEPFGNTLTQSLVGEFIRGEMKRVFKTDLDHLQVIHRKRISNLNDATIDLKNASDGISLSLIEFLLPPRLLRFILESRSPMILGPDKKYYVTRKVSSMGNGFTFELMTLVFTTLCKVLDPNSSVFGDDIIIDRSKSARLVELLTEVGLTVNVEKSFTEGPFRESCGANYHLFEGYVESYDFPYPETIGDCVVTWNKLVRLAPIYPEFSVLRNRLSRILPEALHGGPEPYFEHLTMSQLIGMDRDQRALTIPEFFVTKRPSKSHPRVKEKLLATLSGYQLDTSKSCLVPGFSFRSKESTPCRKHLWPRAHWAKYLMYLSAGRRAKDVITGEGEWKLVWFVRAGPRIFRASALT